ncbi:MAG TPA: MFS transporter [Solirubrobacter sp.]|nr:MFS transporter [Solirubrobacter sp.]
MTNIVPHPKRWLILALILAVECMDLLDGTIVNVAVPTIRADLHASLSALQWIAGGYALTFAIGLVTGGRLGDIFGRRRLFLLGVAGFTATSVLCGAAPSDELLIAFRLLQGAFAAVMVPQGFGILRQVFPPDEIQKAFGLFGPVIGLAAVLGPVLGGALTDGDLFGLGWRAIFLVNLPLGLFALAGAARLLPESRAASRPTLDLGGAALVSAACGLLVYPLIQGREAGWPAWTFALIAAGAAAFAAFVALERRRERAGVSPLVTMSLFRKRAFSAGLACALVFFAGMIGLMLTFSLYLQFGQGFSAIGTGVALIPWSLGTAIGAGLAAGLLGPRFGRATLHGGLLVMLAGVFGLLLTAQDGASAWALAAPEFVAGIGMGALLAPLFNFVLAGVDDDEVGSASGVLNAMQQMGGATGIAVLGTVFFAVAASRGLVSAFHESLWIEAGVLAVTGILVGLLPKRAREEAHV